MADQKKDESRLELTTPKVFEPDEHPARQGQIKRIGILQCIADIDDSALRYLLLSMNSIQDAFQLEFMPFNNEDPFLRPLFADAPIKRPNSSQMLEFHNRQMRHFTKVAAEYEQRDAPPDCLQIISTAKFSDNYFFTSNGLMSVIALGGWKRAMAPPSILEFIQALVLENALFVLCPNLETHLATRGCLMDFSAELSDARQKVLAGYICHECESRISTCGYPGLAHELRPLLSKSWLGSSADATSPAAIVAKLNHNLFITKGLEPNLLERARMTLVQEGAKQILTVIGVVIAALLIALLGIVTDVHLTQPAGNQSPMPTPAARFASERPTSTTAPIP